MKHFVKSAIVAAAALLAACSTDNTVTDNEPKINIKIHAGFPQTRTAFGDKNEDTNSYPVFWDDNDSFAIVEHIAGVQSQVVQAFAEDISDDRKSAEIFAELSMKRGSSFDYYAYSPYKAYSDGKMIIPVAQTPSATSVDPSALLLFASKEGLTAQTPELDLSFGHIAAYARMTVYGLSGENDDIVSVTFSADADLAGTIDVESGTVTNGSKSVTLDVSSLGYTTADKFDIWFTVAPQEEIKTFSVNIATKKGNYTKDFAISGNKPLAFKQGVVSNFTVNMSGSGIKYTSIYVEKKGTLEQVIADYDYRNMEAVKISGVLNDVDFLFIYRMMPKLRDLDISDVEITTLPARAFYESANIKNIILPNTLTIIGENMFYKSSIESISIPDGVKEIGKYAFYNCKLSSIVLPSNIEIIDDYAFNNCYLLTSVTFPASVKRIGAGAYIGCSKLSSITFEKNSQLQIIGSNSNIYDGAFEGCPIASIEIPANVETIKSSTFYDCSKLSIITFEKNSKLKTIDSYAFYRCPITSIEIPASVETIGRSAFKNCSALNTVIFEKESNLKTIDGGYDGSDLYPDYYGAFYNCPITSIEIPASVEYIGPTAFQNCRLSNITFEKGSHLKTIGGGYYYNVAYNSYTGNKIYSYIYGAFANNRFTSIEIPASVEKIGATAFKGCDYLTTVTFEKNSQLTIIEGAWEQYLSYTMVYYYGAFSELHNLMTVDMSECSNVISIGHSCFYGDSELRLFKIGTTIPPTCGRYVFDSVTPASVLKVPNDAVSAYKTANGWSNFASITGLDE